MTTAEPPAGVDKRDARIRGMFAQIAPWYDFLNHLLSLNIDRTWRRKTTRLAPAGPPADGPLLDLCTGTGDLAFGYDAAAKGTLDITGADFCPEMLAVARKKAVARGAADRVHFVEADAQNLPFPTGHFQLVTVAFGLRNVADTDRGLAEMVRVTKPGGRIAVLEFSRPRGVIGWFYRAYFQRLLPFVGQLISRSPDSAYNYLPASVMAFPDGDALADRMRAAGLSDVRFTPFTFGIATLYIGAKPAAG
ncbi:MAG: bifunctional demethylmenaquinone methyltransferase/2-methoxy-6-polyprenyl-1,4-benzoquinol methylase UbiE [Fimbriiglobus sp.]